jgi:hypothetical protein
MRKACQVPLPRGTDRRAHARLALIMLGALLVRVAFFNGYTGTDDTYYLEAAYRVSVGDPGAFDSYFATRSGLVLPTAAAFAVAGVRPATIAWLPLACSLGAMHVAFLLGRRLFTSETGLLAAFLLAVFPLDVIFATQLFACVPVAWATGLSLYYLLRKDAGGHRLAALAASGTCLGVATLLADTAWFCLLPAGWFFLSHRRPFSEWLSFSAAVLLAPAFELLFYAVLTGDPWQRWRLLSAGVAVQGFDALSSGLGWAYLLQPFVRLVSEQEFGLYPLACVPALVWHAVRAPSRYSRFLVVWIVVLFLYTSYGTTSPLHFAPLPRLPRYLSVLEIPALVLLASLLRTRGVRVRRAIVVVLTASSLACVWVDNGRVAKALPRSLVAFMEERRGERFVLDRPLMLDVRLLTAFREDSRLAILARNDGEARLVESRRAVYGPAPVVRDVASLPGALVAVLQPQASGWAATGERLEPVTTFTRPDRLYIRLLRHPAFMRVFAHLRDRHRVDGMTELARERIEVYRVP